MKKRRVLITVLVLLIVACSSVLVFGETFGSLTAERSYYDIDEPIARAALINQDSAIAVAKTNQTTCVSTALIIGGSLIISAALKRGKRAE